MNREKKQKIDVEKPKRVKRTKVKLEELPDAVVDGKMIVPPGGKVFFERRLSTGRIAVHEGIIREITANGIVQIWDESVEQFYAFSLFQQLPIIKVG